MMWIMATIGFLAWVYCARKQAKSVQQATSMHGIEHELQQVQATLKQLEQDYAAASHVWQQKYTRFEVNAQAELSELTEAQQKLLIQSKSLLAQSVQSHNPAEITRLIKAHHRVVAEINRLTKWQNRISAQWQQHVNVLNRLTDQHSHNITRIDKRLHTVNAQLVQHEFSRKNQSTNTEHPVIANSAAWLGLWYLTLDKTVPLSVDSQIDDVEGSGFTEGDDYDNAEECYESSK